MASVLSLPRAELKSVGLISIGHGFSHLYMLVLPPLFTLIRADLGVSWTDLGLLIAVFSVSTGIAQLPAGILVDRIGGRPVLFAGLVLQAAPFALVALFPTYWGLMAMVLVAGIGVAVFHPADYAILAAQVDGERQGRAFGIHIFAGYAGWVVAPPLMLALASVLDWAAAVSVSGLIGLLFTAIAALYRGALDDRAIRAAPGDGGEAVARGLRARVRFLLSPPVLLFLVFFTALATGTSGIHAFAVVALVELYDASLAAANAQLTGYFAAAAVGVLIGGVIADRVRDQEGLAALCFVASAAFLGVIALKLLPLAYVIIPMLGSAVTIGLMSPSRDLLVRKICPPGTIGTVFGFVTTGFSVGAAIGPPIFGYVADIGRPDLIFWLSGAFTLLCIVSIYAAKAVAR
ncbi:MAG: MFS transporter [Defluviicoccus sp.]|nr:MFS transporter [Defluviicoccus sp.]